MCESVGRKSAGGTEEEGEDGREGGGGGDTWRTKARSTETICVNDLTIPRMYWAGTEEEMSTSI